MSAFPTWLHPFCTTGRLEKCRRARDGKRRRRLGIEMLEERQVLSAAPVLVNNTGWTVVGSAPFTLTSTQLLATDADNTAAELTFTISELPMHGTLRLNNVALGLGGPFTQQDVNDGKVTYVSQPSQSGNDGFSFGLSDHGPTTGLTRVSVDGQGNQLSNRSADFVSMSADGRYVAFTILTGSPGNVKGSAFVRDNQSGQTTRVDVDSAGNPGNDGSYAPVISADGRYVAFASTATNLVTDDTNFSQDVFVHDMQTGETTRVSVDSSGNQGFQSSGSEIAISSDGRYVAFISDVGTLVVGDTNGRSDAFVHDRQTGTTTRGSVDSEGNELSSSCTNLAISDDGQFLAFISNSNAYVHGFQSGATTLVSIDSDGGFANGPTQGFITISGDGRYVVFTSLAPDLVAGETSFTQGLYVRDRQIGQTFRISGGSTNLDAGFAYNGAVSANGRYVSFVSNEKSLLPGEDNPNLNTFFRDLQTGTVARVSVGPGGRPDDGTSGFSAVSDDGRFVAFVSSGSGLVAEDTNAVSDVFLRDLSVVLGSTLIVTPINSAPVLNTTKSPALVSVREDAAVPTGAVGTLVSALANAGGTLSNVTDSDAGALTGIAVTAVDVSHGTAYFSINNGASWQLLGSVSSTSSRLLAADANTRIYFRPNANFNGTLAAAITFRAWDRSFGTNGSPADTSTNGGATPYSTATDTASLQITAVNDAPTLNKNKSPALTTELEDAGLPKGAVGTLVSKLVDVTGALKNVTDVDNGAFVGIAVTAADVSHGNWYYSLNNGVTWSALGNVSNTSARCLLADAATRLYFRPVANYNGVLPTAITLSAWDRTFGANGNLLTTASNGGTTCFSAMTDTASLVITPVNDAPLLNATKSPTLGSFTAHGGNPVGAVETSVAKLVDITGTLKNVTDADAGAVVGIAVTAAATTIGTWFYTTNNGVTWLALGNVSNTLARLLAADANTRLYFKPAANFKGTIASAITFRAWDRTSGTNGGLLSTAVNGTTTAFSTATDTASILVT